MAPAKTQANVELLEKLVLGQLPVEEAERLAIECADDSRLAALAEGLAGRDDTLVNSLRAHQTLSDAGVDDLAQNLVRRLKDVTAPEGPSSDTMALFEETPAAQQAMPESLEYFRVQKVLGQGGMGTVYLAVDTRLGRQVALKTLKQELALKAGAKDRFLREARSAARLEHDHVIPIYYVGEADGTPFLAMPFLQGEPLDCRIGRARKSGTALPTSDVVRIARQTASGLAKAHAQGLIHRDIKPANIWMETVGSTGEPGESETGAFRVKILDFGLAHCQDDDAHLTASGAILGTPSYMAPEQARGMPIDPRVDLFSLGTVLYEMLTLQRPFTGSNTMAVLTSLAVDIPRAPIEINPHCPAALSQFTMRLLAKDPRERPASARVVEEALAKMERSLTPAPAVAASRSSPENDNSQNTFSLTAPSTISATLVAPQTRAAGTFRTRKFLFAVGLLALVPLLWWLATIILRIETENGTLIVEIKDEKVEARFKNGKLILTGPDGKDLYTLAPSERSKKLDAGPYKIRVEGADGLTLDTPEFTLRRGGEVTVRVTYEPKDAVAAKEGGPIVDPDRRAAEYVLSMGGEVAGYLVDGRPMERLSGPAPLPKDFSRLTFVALANNTKVTDTGLAAFQGCDNLETLAFENIPVGDAGMIYFKGKKHLRFLNLSGTKITDASLGYFAENKNWTHLWLTGTKVSDAGLANFKDCGDLLELGLDDTKASDAGLANFKDCKKLTALVLNNCQVSDAGMKYFHNCEQLDRLSLSNSQVGDAGLMNFKNCKRLWMLDLSNCARVGNAGIGNFKRCENLRTLQLLGTAVTDEGLVYFAACKKLEVLTVSEKVTDAGLIHFKDCNNLSQIVLLGTRISDSGLATFRDCKNLSSLNLQNTMIGDSGLSHLKDCKNLYQIDLNGTRVGNPGLANLRYWQELRSLVLEQTQVSDAALTHLKDCRNLLELGLKKTKVTAAGIEQMKKALPRCRIEWDGGAIEPTATLDLDRRAAEYVLSIGGRIDGGLQGPAVLPEGFSRLTSVFLDKNEGVTDEGLAAFKDCKNVTTLLLGSTKVSDGGLVHFKECKSLNHLSLSRTKVSDAGLIHFKGCETLSHVDLADTSIGDAGLAYFKQCKILTLQSTKVSDAGFAHLKDYKDLTYLTLNNTSISDAGLGYLKDCNRLTFLALNGTRISDAGLAQFKDMELTKLALFGTKISDAGLAYLRDCKSLVSLDVRITKVTAIGIDQVKKALPRCKIEWDGGVIEPMATLDPDRRAAEYVLSIGGTVHINEDVREIKDVVELPPAAFRLTRVNFAYNKTVTDDDLAIFKDCKNLLHLVLMYTRVSDAGLAHFKDCKELNGLYLSYTKATDAGLNHFRHHENLTTLDVAHTRVTDAGLGNIKNCKRFFSLFLENTDITDIGLAQFKGCRTLSYVRLYKTDLTDAGLAYLKDCRDLISLSLSYTKVTDAGLAHFKNYTRLNGLELEGTQVGDAGLDQLKNCKGLRMLKLKRTNVTAPGLDMLRASLPACRIEWDGGVIEPATAISEPNPK